MVTDHVIMINRQYFLKVERWLTALGCSGDQIIFFLAGNKSCRFKAAATKWSRDMNFSTDRFTV